MTHRLTMFFERRVMTYTADGWSKEATIWRVILRIVACRQCLPNAGRQTIRFSALECRGLLR